MCMPCVLMDKLFQDFFFFSVQVLIYDKFGSDIISPLLSVKELRNLGVTLHL